MVVAEGSGIQSGLRRELGLLQFFSLAFGAIIGVGWITVLGEWLGEAGSLGAAAAFAAGFVVVFLVALAYGELAAMLPTTGGEVSFAQYTFGTFAAFTVATMLLLAYIGAIAFEMISVGWIASAMAPALRGQPLYEALGETVFTGELVIEVAAMVLVAGMNMGGARMAARLQDAMTLALIVVGIVLVIAAVFKGSLANLEPLFVLRGADWKLGGLFLVFSTSLFFYAGFNFATQALGERSASTSPGGFGLSIGAAILGALIFYCSIIISAASLLPRGELLALDLPAAGAFEAAFGSVLFRNIVLFGGLLGLVTSWNAVLFAAARILLILSRLGIGPPALGQVNPRRGTPDRAIIAVTILGGLGALLGREAVLPIVSLAGLGIAFAWAVMAAAAFRLRRVEPSRVRPFRVIWGAPVFAVAALGSVFALGTTVQEALLSSASGAKVTRYVLIGWLVASSIWWISTRSMRRVISEDGRKSMVAAASAEKNGDANAPR
jgi:amino acid transporter